MTDETERRRAAKYREPLLRYEYNDECGEFVFQRRKNHKQPWRVVSRHRYFFEARRRALHAGS